MCVPECVRVLLENYVGKDQGAEGKLGCLRKWTYKTIPEQVEGKLGQASRDSALC